MKRILLTGGGTGGHIYPALSIAKEVKRRYPNVSIAYIGTEAGLESTIVSKEKHIKFYTIHIQGFKRNLSFSNIGTVYKFFKAVKKSKKLIEEFQPEVVIGTGGYVSGPPVYSSYRLGIPTLIHEQNVVPGLTTKFLARFVSKIAVSFEQSGKYFKQGTPVIYTGNPRATDVIRADSLRGRKSLGILENEKKIVVFVGGSQGARIMNETVRKMVPYFGQLPQVHFVYITGPRHFEVIRREIAVEKIPNLEIYPFLYNLPDVLAAAHLVISRAGASTLAELTSLGVPSILIPSPYVTNNHQTRNAAWLEEKGACEMIEEKDCTIVRVWEAICELIKNKKKHDDMSYNARRLGLSESAELIVNELEKLIKTGDRHVIAR